MNWPTDLRHGLQMIFDRPGLEVFYYINEFEIRLQSI